MIKIKSKIIVLIFLMVGSSTNINLIQAAPGDSSSEPIIAVIGSNSGNLIDEFDRVWFKFIPDGSQSTYLLTLNGPSNTDFDSTVTFESGQYIGGNGDISYPDKLTITGITNPILIEVYSFEGSGDFTLTISVSSEISKFSFSPELKKGNTYNWDVKLDQTIDPSTSTYYDSDVDFGFDDGDVFSIEMLADGDQIVIDPNSDIDIFDYFSLTRNSQSDPNLFDDFVTLFIFPTSISYDNGTSIGIVNALNAEDVDLPSGQWIQDEGEVKLVTSETNELGSTSFEIIYDISSGLLNLIQTTSIFGNNSFELTITRQGISDRGNGPLESLPVATTWLFLVLIAIPIIRKRKI